MLDYEKRKGEAFDHNKESPDHALNRAYPMIVVIKTRSTGQDDSLHDIQSVALRSNETPTWLQGSIG